MQDQKKGILHWIKKITSEKQQSLKSPSTLNAWEMLTDLEKN